MEISEMIEDIKGGVVRFKEQAARNEAAIKELQGRAVNRSNAFDAALKEAILENYEKLNHIEKYRRVDFRVKAASDMTFTANFANADNSITQVKPGIVPLPNRKVHIRELLPAGTMGTSDFAFVRETGKDGDVSVWQISDGNKSQFDINFTEATAPSEYIAGFLVIGRKMLDDVAGLTSFLQGRLLQMYLNAEDTELLTGNGTSPHLQGLSQMP